MKKAVSVLTAFVMMLTFVCAFALPAAAEDDGKETVANYYLLNEGLIVPTGTASQPTKNYSKAGTGTIKVASGYYNPDGVDAVLGTVPEVEGLKPGQSVIWYVVKHEGDGWHVDGVIVPFTVFLYEPGAADATGNTTDATHYFKGSTASVKENGYLRSGYTFTGWNTELNGSGTAYQPADQIAVNEFKQQINTVILYAQWKETTPTKKMTAKVVTPKKMAIRLEDGTVLYNGDSFKIAAGQEIRFQMCSVNWDNGIYDDNGNGLAGTVVYTVKVSDSYTGRSYDEATHTFTLPKGDLTLRTDVNSCFMAYRYHFQKGDYNKQTGVAGVVNSPLESLSVNLPLGSTITSDAYKANQKIDTANVFIARDLLHPDRSYTDYYWAY